MAVSFQYSHEFKGKRADEVYDKVMVERERDGN